jgi:hypothetical protein
MNTLQVFYALIIPCLLTPAIHSIYPITKDMFRLEMLSGFVFFDIGLIVVTLLLATLGKYFEWRVFAVTYVYMLLLFAANVLLSVYVWSGMDTTSLASIAISCALQFGLAEEALKIACWIPWTFVARRKKVDPNMLPFIAALSALFFAVNENFHMLTLLALSDNASEDSVVVILASARVLWGPLIHIAFTMIGFSVWQRALTKAFWPMYILVPIVPAFIHGLYDFLIFVDVPWCSRLAPLAALITIITSVLLQTHFKH